MSFVVAMVRTEAAKRSLAELEAPFPLRFVDTCVELARLGTESGVLGVVVDVRDVQGKSPERRSRLRGGFTRDYPFCCGRNGTT